MAATAAGETHDAITFRTAIPVESVIATESLPPPPPPQASASISYSFKSLRPTCPKPVRTNRKRAKEGRSKRYHKSDRKNAKFEKDAMNGVHDVECDEPDDPDEPDYYCYLDDYSGYSSYDDHDHDGGFDYVLTYDREYRQIYDAYSYSDSSFSSDSEH